MNNFSATQPTMKRIYRKILYNRSLNKISRMRLNRFTLNAHDSLSPFLLLAASRTRNASRWYRELVRIKGDNKGGGNETVVSERNEDRAISYRAPSARKQFIPLRCSTLIRPTFFFHFSDPVPSLSPKSFDLACCAHLRHM